MASELFTFIMDFGGGTYVSQVPGPFSDACRLWARSLDLTEVPLTEDARNLLTREADDESLTAIAGLENVWCFSPLIGEGLAVVHVVRTATNA